MTSPHHLSTPVPPTALRRRRRRRSALLVPAAVLVLLAAGCWAPSLDDGAYAVTVTRDVVYGTGKVAGGTKDLTMDLYTPRDTGQDQLPLVVVVHGGGFVGGSKSEGFVVSWAREFASRGYLVASIDYRLSGMDPTPSPRMQPLVDALRAQQGTISLKDRTAISAMGDTLMAMEVLIARPDTLDDRTTLVGGSAGAGIINHLAYVFDDVGISRPPIGAVVANWGGGLADRDPALFVQNPTPTLADPYREPPMFMAHTTGDPTVPYAGSLAMLAQATSVGLDAELFTKVGATHGFDLAAEPYDAERSVLDAQVDWVTCHVYPHLGATPGCS